MSAKEFPIICEIAVLLTDGERIARFTGPQTNGHGPDKKFSLEVIADAILAAERNGMPNARVVTPTELLETVAADRGFGRIALVGCAKEWSGFTKEELDAAVAEQRAKGDEDDEDDEDDDEEEDD